MEGPMIAYLPRQKVEAIVASVLVFDREPLGENVLLKAVRYVAERLDLEIEEERSPNRDI
jgi:hypothetical protein